jgi:transcriptional regulator with XRE-family HTH domain
MPTSGQLRAARALLGWTMVELAGRAGISARTVARCEIGEGVPRVTVRTIERIVRVLEAAGVQFLHGSDGPGVRLRRH